MLLSLPIISDTYSFYWIWIELNVCLLFYHSMHVSCKQTWKFPLAVLRSLAVNPYGIGTKVKKDSSLPNPRKSDKQQWPSHRTECWPIFYTPIPNFLLSLCRRQAATIGLIYFPQWLRPIIFLVVQRYYPLVEWQVQNFWKGAEGRKTMYQPCHHLSQTRTMNYMPFIRKKWLTENILRPIGGGGSRPHPVWIRHCFGQHQISLEYEGTSNAYRPGSGFVCLTARPVTLIHSACQAVTHWTLLKASFSKWVVNRRTGWPKNWHTWFVRLNFVKHNWSILKCINVKKLNSLKQLLTATRPRIHHTTKTAKIKKLLLYIGSTSP